MEPQSTTPSHHQLFFHDISSSLSRNPLFLAKSLSDRYIKTASPQKWNLPQSELIISALKSLESGFEKAGEIEVFAENMSIDFHQSEFCRGKRRPLNL
jgi:hypothetical protein